MIRLLLALFPMAIVFLVLVLTFKSNSDDSEIEQSDWLVSLYVLIGLSGDLASFGDSAGRPCYWNIVWLAFSKLNAFIGLLATSKKGVLKVEDFML